MGWPTFHRRGDTLRDVVQAANERRDGIIPRDVPGVAENFEGDLDLLGALQLKWHARLSGNIERAMMLEPMDLRLAVVSAWRTTAEQLAGVRLVIDRCLEEPTEPAMAAAAARASRLESAHLATAAGLASGHSEAAVEVGRRLVKQARREDPATSAENSGPSHDDTATAAPAPGRHAARESFADRIRAALAAA